MARTRPAQTALNAGEQSPNLAARPDLAVYANGGLWVQNFKVLVSGAGQYREGTVLVWPTRDNAVCRLISFNYNDEQAYDLCFQDQIMRIVKDGALVTQAAQAITNITKANPAVVTYVGADTYANGDRIVLSGVVGMREINNQEYEVANVNVGANTFQLLGVNSLAYTAYASGGTVAEIVEVVVPWDDTEIWDIKVAQTFDTMYIVHPDYAPRKLTRSSHTSWALSTATLLCNPFGTTKAATQAISAITKANPAVVTYVGVDTYANGDIIFVDAVVGMGEVNGRVFTVANVNTGANTFELSGIDSTDYTAYTSAGTVAEFTVFSYPSIVTFYENRLIYGASDSFSQRIWASRAAAVTADYDSFDTGTGLADDAFIYNISNGKGNRIRWMQGTEKFLALGTSGGEFKADGGNENPLTPTSISVKTPSFFGSADVEPIRLDSHILYIQRDKKTARTFEFDALQDGYTSINRNLTADHILQGRYGMADGVKDMAFQQGNPSVNWLVRNDGALVGLTFEPREQVNGWHRHYFGGIYAAGKNGRPEVESVSCTPRPDNTDRATFVVARTIGNATKRYIEYFADQPNIPTFEDYYTGAGNKAADTTAFLLDMWEAQKRLHYVDCALVYDGTVSQTMTLSAAAVGAGATATAGGATFAATDVGREIRGKAGGRAVITGYTSTTVVTVAVLVAFPSVLMASTYWYLTSASFSGLQHLEGEEAFGLGDGGTVDFGFVSGGTVETETQYSYAVIGLKYTGIFKTMDQSPPSELGTGTGTRKTTTAVMAYFRDTLGTEVGTSLYNRTPIPFRDTSDLMGRPPPLYSGPKTIKIDDNWADEKHIYFVQEQPQPCTILMVQPDMSVNDG